MADDNGTQFHYSNGGSHLRVDQSVTTIPAGAFRGRTDLTEVELPGTIQTIGENAFYGCSSLRVVHLRDGLVTIGERAFAGCIQLEHIDVPSTVIDINNAAFHGCISLEEVNLCEGLRTIGHRVLNESLGVFYGCISLRRIEIPSTVPVITAWAFDSCTSLEEVLLHEGLQAIKAVAFARCRSLKHIFIPSTVTSIEAWAFDACFLLDLIYFPNSRWNGALPSESIVLRTNIVSSVAYAECGGLCLRVDSSVTSIPDSSELNLKCLAKVELPEDLQALRVKYLFEGLLKIGEEEFAVCTTSKSIVVPSTVTAICDGTFHTCTSLEEIRVRGLREGILTISRGGESDIGRSFCGVFIGLMYLQSISIPSTVTVITSLAFAGCTALESVHLSEGIQTIEECAFYGCKSLLRITIPSTVTVIRESAFARCTSLIEAHLCEGLRNICECAFFWCISLLRINVPSTVNVIEYGAFQYCSNLRNVTIAPSSMLGQACFDESFANFAEVNCTFDMLRRRFDDLPIHELCHTVKSNEELQTLMEVIQLHSAHGFPVDCLGMTPLHILACSGNRNVRLYRCYLECFPDAIIDEDNWGETPLGYIVFSGNSEEILHIFMETCKKRWDVLPFDIGNMLTKFISAERARRFIQALRRYFPDLVIDWQEIVEQSMACAVPFQVFRFFVEASVSSRNNCMSTDHRIETDQWIAEYEGFLGIMDSIHMGPFYEELRTLVIQFTQEHREFLLIVSTMLELALWKAVLNESLLENNDRTIRSDLRVNAGQMFQVVSVIPMPSTMR